MKQLTPAQRAWFQLAESMLITATIAGLLSIAPLLAGDGAINWRMIDATFGLAAIFSVAHSLVAYFKPTQPDLSAAIEQIIDELERRYETKHIQDTPQASTTPVAPPSTTTYQPIQLSSQHNPMSFSAPVGGFAWTVVPDLTSQPTTPHPSVQPPQDYTS